MVVVAGLGVGVGWDLGLGFEVWGLGFGIRDLEIRV